jgi:DNA-binding response OmpR family regulator
LAPSSSPDITGQRIIVLDSNPVLVSVTGVLRMAGYCVFQAYDGQAAEELCRTLGRISLLVLNTHVDGMSGALLMENVRDRRPELPILHIDTHRDPTIPGGVPTLIEPFTAAQLLAAVDELLKPSGTARPAPPGLGSTSA